MPGRKMDYLPDAMTPETEINNAVEALSECCVASYSNKLINDFNRDSARSILRALLKRINIDHRANQEGAALTVEAIQEDLKSMRDSRDRMKEAWESAEIDLNRCKTALTELRAIVKGECPSLLNEDSGGNGELDLQIAELLK